MMKGRYSRLPVLVSPIQYYECCMLGLNFFLKPKQSSFWHCTGDSFFKQLFKFWVLKLIPFSAVLQCWYVCTVQFLENQQSTVYSSSTWCYLMEFFFSWWKEQNEMLGNVLLLIWQLITLHHVLAFTVWAGKMAGLHQVSTAQQHSDPILFLWRWGWEQLHLRCASKGNSDWSVSCCSF